jgi:hypothetical protein
MQVITTRTVRWHENIRPKWLDENYAPATTATLHPSAALFAVYSVYAVKIT